MAAGVDQREDLLLPASGNLQKDGAANVALDDVGRQLRADLQVALRLSHPAFNGVVLAGRELEIRRGGEHKVRSFERCVKLERTDAAAQDGRQLPQRLEDVGDGLDLRAEHHLGVEKLRRVPGHGLEIVDDGHDLAESVGTRAVAECPSDESSSRPANRCAGPPW